MAVIYNNGNDNGDWLGHLIAFWLFIPSIALCMMLSGCKSVKYVPIKSKDSVRVDTRYIRYTEKDTVFVEIPAQAAERTAADSVSHLENDFAVSDARINADGTLFHNLKTKPQKKPVPVDKVIERKDTIVYVDKKVEVPVPVEKKLGWWDRTSINLFSYSLGIIAVLAYIIIWLVRKRRN